jgi:ribosomal-protein-alanine N-acetyltransferase
MADPAVTLELAAMRWWHIGAIVGLEAELFGDEAWSREAFWSELANPACTYLVAGPDPVIGYGGVAVSGPEAYIQTIGVAPSAQRLGIGRRLMDALLAEAIRRNAVECWLEVRTDNAVAQRLYRTLGFVDRGIRRGYYQPSGTDALVMAAPLQPAPMSEGVD